MFLDIFFRVPHTKAGNRIHTQAQPSLSLGYSIVPVFPECQATPPFQKESWGFFMKRDPSF
jgi:hypothetical protein